MLRCAQKSRRAVSRRAVSAPITAGAAALRSKVAALIGEGPADADRFGIAVSGGPDSLALLLFAQAAFPRRVAAASVNHRLRAEATAECAYVAAICAELGVSHSILVPETPPRPTQADARYVRYDLLEDWRVASGIDWLMTGHHADDQLETMIMRLNRSSGVSGLAGVRARNGHVLRPLLAWRHLDLVAAVAAVGIMPVDDPSNRDPRHDRSRLRAAMAGQDWIDAVAASESAMHLSEAEDALAWMAEQLIDDRVTRVDGGFDIVIDAWPTELLRRVVAGAMAIGPRPAPRGADLDRFIASLTRGKPATLGGWAAKADRNRPSHWQFRHEQGRRNS